MISLENSSLENNSETYQKKETEVENWLPIIDISNLQTEAGKKIIAKEIHDACKEFGFFYIRGHGIEESLIENLESVASRFFSLPLDVKMKWKMNQVKRDWLGFFKVGQEITYGAIDHKEGAYLDVEQSGDSDPSRGIHLYPTPEEEELYGIVGFKNTIETYIKQLTVIGKEIMQAIALSLNLPSTYFDDKYSNPSTLMGILNYPSYPKNPDDSSEGRFGTNEHTDWGCLTILHRTVEGLQVKSGDGFIDAPPVPGAFICNIGDMLDRITGGYYLSNVHRVKLNTSGSNQITYPFFLDPNWDSVPQLIEGIPKVPQPARWDNHNIHQFKGTYGQYFMTKVGRVFPEYVYNEENKSNVHK
ncbi:hypothetical protein DICPUDRAFT_92205 [Dictyostelium purpureum]|uniref:Fe2OG dioxygenase domain-containing protein n=1 Tax=Dictyostelium purpureum TaxID=5786 RepID=F0ZNH5_DICPU|nr:uncharacterized protein DICPUDRAFT_92205 [Dictyostelium purpureum]EGC34533.1 hypothetical protein DICPUDRAFT_92205 [Dictyostelium purpureum]|eukprot:XP_003288969.1 hypothetical protein DICPUDRAFT_92205 [Dictyostelium purpureum]